MCPKEKDHVKHYITQVGNKILNARSLGTTPEAEARAEERYKMRSLLISVEPSHKPSDTRVVRLTADVATITQNDTTTFPSENILEVSSVVLPKVPVAGLNHVDVPLDN